MSRIYLKASKDASIYEVYPNLNTGYDEILEVGKHKNDLTFINGAVRSLIEFDLTDLKGAPTSSTVFLNLKVADATKLHQDELIYIYQVSQSWAEGSGYSMQTPLVSDDGATWSYALSGSRWAASGSDYNTTPVVSSSVTDLTNDELRIDVTDLIAPMISGSSVTSNYGLILKFSGSSENSSNNEGNVKFFSRQTHTVHEPLLELAYISQSFATGSLKTLPTFDIEIAPNNLRAEYEVGSISKLYFTVRDRYPAKSYSNTRRFANRYYLPSSSQYTVIDSTAGTTIEPFDVYSHIHCDATGSYVKLDTRSLYKNRFYDLKLKVTLGEEIYFTKPFRFKAV
jgi:hypothetical protein